MLTDFDENFFEIYHNEVFNLYNINLLKNPVFACFLEPFNPQKSQNLTFSASIMTQKMRTKCSGKNFFSKILKYGFQPFRRYFDG